MDALEAILTRRSIRKFQSKDVSDDLIQKLLEAAMSAPSAHNEQPWHFIVVRDRAILDEIPKVHPYAKMLLEAPVGIIVCGDHQLEKDPQAGYWVQDCAAAVQNLLLAAHALGLGACWIGIHPRQNRKDALRDLCGLPTAVEPFAAVALGWPNEQKTAPSRFNPHRLHRDLW
jgi:nitroreductase